MDQIITFSEQDLREELQERFMAQSSVFKDSNEKFSSLEDDQERVIGQGFYRLGKVYYDKADLSSAEDYFLRALDKTVYPKDAFAIFKIYGFLIRIYSESLNEKQADRFIALAEAHAEKLSKDLGSLGSEYFYNVGMVHTYKGEIANSFDNFKLSYEKAQTENEPELIAKSLFSMATACYHLNKQNEALNYLTQLEELLTILKKGYLKGSMHMLYGNIYKDIGKLDKAMNHFDDAIIELQQKNCWNLYPYILLGKGIVLKKKGEFKQSLIFFDLANKTVGRSNFKRLKALVCGQVEDVNDSSVDIYLDRHNRVIHEKTVGTIDFKHRFVLLEILFLLARCPGQHFNKDDLAKSIWKDEYNPLIHDKLIYTSISRLRKLLEPKSGPRKYILRGKDGYKFNPMVNARFHREEDTTQQKIIGNVEISSPV